MIHDDTNYINSMKLSLSTSLLGSPADQSLSGTGAERTADCGGGAATALVLNGCRLRCGKPLEGAVSLM